MSSSAKADPAYTLNYKIQDILVACSHYRAPKGILIYYIRKVQFKQDIIAMDKAHVWTGYVRKCKGAVRIHNRTGNESLTKVG